MLTRFIIFGILGVCAGVLVSAIMRSIEGKRLELNGESSLILFPLCGLGAIIFPIIAIRVSHFPWYGRGIAYMIVFFVVQYLAGLLLSRINLCPWSYSGKGSLGGLIRIGDAPIWFGCGLLLERAYPFIRAAAVALG